MSIALWLFPWTGACVASVDEAAEKSTEIPVPPWIDDSELLDLEDGRTQLSFSASEEYPSSRIRDFYAEWAEKNDWEKVPPEEEEWSTDQWVAYTSAEGVSLDQWTVQWRSPDRQESLRLAVLHSDDRSKQEIYVIKSPYFLLDDALGIDHTNDPVNMEDPCPSGELVDVTPLYQPFPSATTISERCLDPITPTSPLLTINEEGKVETVQLLRSSGCAFADDEFRRCIKEWIFTPATCDGQAITVERGTLLQWDDLDESDREDFCEPYSP